MESTPSFFKPILWSYNFSDLDPIRNKKTIIVSAINCENTENNGLIFSKEKAVKGAVQKFFEDRVGEIRL